MHYEKSNRKAIDVNLMAFKEFLNQYPNCFLFIHSPTRKTEQSKIEFKCPDNYTTNSTINLTHPSYGPIQIQNNTDKVWKPGETVTDFIINFNKEISQNACNIKNVALSIGIPENKLLSGC